MKTNGRTDTTDRITVPAMTRSVNIATVHAVEGLTVGNIERERRVSAISDAAGAVFSVREVSVYDEPRPAINTQTGARTKARD